MSKHDDPADAAIDRAIEAQQKYRRHMRRKYGKLAGFVQLAQQNTPRAEQLSELQADVPANAKPTP